MTESPEFLKCMRDIIRRCYVLGPRARGNEKERRGTVLLAAINGTLRADHVFRKAGRKLPANDRDGLLRGCGGVLLQAEKLSGEPHGTGCRRRTATVRTGRGRSR